MTVKPWTRRWAGVAMALAVGCAAAIAAAPTVAGPAWAQETPVLAPEGGATARKMPERFPVPDDAAGSLAPYGTVSDSEIWREVRRGVTGQVPVPDRWAGVLVQSEGDSWRNVKNGPLASAGWWVLALVVAAIALFFAVRGRVRIDAGPSGRRVERFTAFERFVHWLTAGSFVVLAITGLNLMYGRHLFAMDPAGDLGDFTALHNAFAAITYYGKLAHNFLGFSFIVGIVLMFVIWVRHNLPNRHDVVWLMRAGGLLTAGVHPPAKKFNAGQKLIFWIVILGGGSLAWSGIGLLFPYQVTPFAETFAFFNLFGLDLPTQLTALEEMQLMQAWHAVLGILLIAVIIAHIYIGTLGMEGAFDAVNSGMVDENWAREHHSLWVEEIESAPPSQPGAGGAEQPAE